MMYWVVVTDGGSDMLINLDKVTRITDDGGGGVVLHIEGEPVMHVDSMRVNSEDAVDVAALAERLHRNVNYIRPRG